jgi:hypothetical protein
MLRSCGLISLSARLLGSLRNRCGRSIRNFSLRVSVIDSLFYFFSFVVPIEASEFEVEFFLRGVECETQFAKKSSGGHSFFFILLSFG